MIIDHGTFRLYTPERPDPRFAAARALFLKNEFDVDWYVIAHEAAVPGHVYVCIGDAGEVRSLDTDHSKLWPIDMKLIETDQHVAHNMIFNGSEFVIPPPPPPRPKAEPDFDG